MEENKIALYAIVSQFRFFPVRETPVFNLTKGKKK
jgi:hypothetical protein